MDIVASNQMIPGEFLGRGSTYFLQGMNEWPSQQHIHPLPPLDYLIIPLLFLRPNYRLLGVGSLPGPSGPHGSQFSRQTLPSTIRPLRKVTAAPERLPDRLLTAGGS